MKAPRVWCIVCKKEYSAKGIFTHYDRNHGSNETQQKYSSGHNKSYTDKKYIKRLTEGQRKRFEKTLGKYKDYSVNCAKCKTTIVVNERETQFPSKEKYFCSLSCANSRNRDNAFKEKMLGTRYYNPLTNTSFIDFVYCGNNECKKLFVVNKRNKDQQFCGNACSAQERSKDTDRSDWHQYKLDARFRFNLSDFPDEFDFALVEQYGWYGATNRTNNLNGVSRDHMISVRYGFDNSIDPSIISHPANCKLMRHRDNKRKHTNISMSKEELIEKIRMWDIKYTKN